jgi:hypothetical protein
VSSIATRNPQTRRVLAVAVVASAAYFAGLRLCVHHLATHPGGRFATVAALAPILGIAAALAAMFTSTRLADELHQRIHLEAMSFAFLALLFVVSARDMLDFLGVRIGQPAFLMPVMVLLWLTGLALSLFRYR